MIFSLPFLQRFKQILTTTLSSVFSTLLYPNKYQNALQQDRTQHPLLSPDDVMKLADQFSQLGTQISTNTRPSQALRQGNQYSQFTGSGLEYEESRPYEAGDEVRRINWPLMAKTGKAYTKYFLEDRQENHIILLDHRQSMRFGTHKRLKATQATRIAGYFAWLSQQSNTPVMGARLAENLIKTPIFEGYHSYTQLMETFIQPCPPITPTSNKRTDPSYSQEPLLNDVLLDLLPHIPPGSHLTLISDFHDLTPQITKTLITLKQKTTIQAIWIQDPVEIKLPNIYPLTLQSLNTDQIITIQSKTQQMAYQNWSQTYHKTLQSYLKKAGITPHLIQADAPINAFRCFL